MYTHVIIGDLLLLMWFIEEVCSAAMHVTCDKETFQLGSGILAEDSCGFPQLSQVKIPECFLKIILVVS
jgi:hypothetical protein